MKILNSKAGSVVISKCENRNAFLSIDGVTIGTDFTSFISEFHVSKSDIFSVNNCFNEYTCILAFGHNAQQSTARVTINTFLLDNLCASRDESSAAGGLISKLVQYYNNGRVGVSGQKSGSFSCGSFHFQGPITDISVYCNDPGTNLVTIELSMLIMESIDAQ